MSSTRRNDLNEIRLLYRGVEKELVRAKKLLRTTSIKAEGWVASQVKSVDGLRATLHALHNDVPRERGNTT